MAVLASALPTLAEPAREAERWVAPVAWVALAVFVAVPVFAYFVQSLAGRVVWTVVVAALPLFIVLVGYHRWRRLCPLAFFALLPVRLRRPGMRRASEWLEDRSYSVAFSVFFLSLWLRLVATNGSGPAVAAFFVLLSLAALTVGAMYTGKTWCNYICPVSFIEKIYTEPHGLRETRNSQCAKCTACKNACPDINEENGYWKEISSRSRRDVTFAFPGLVFGFYFYYFLQAGTWRKAFAEETLGRAIVKRWAWTDTQPPRDLREAFFLQTVRSQESVKAYAQVLKIYKEAISESLADGFVTRDQTAVLESLRVQLQIRKAEHERVMAELAAEERATSGDPAKPVSAEKRLQLETYASVLRRYLDRVLGSDAAQDDRFLAQLRSEYRVTPAEHAAVLDKILGGVQGMAGGLAGELAVIERVSLTILELQAETSAAHAFLGDLLRRWRERAVDRLLSVLRLAPEETSRRTREDLCSADQTTRSAAIERQLSAVVAPEIAERLLAAHRQTATIVSGSTLTEKLRARTESSDPYVRAVALYILATRGEAEDELLVRLSSDEHELVQETARHFRDETRRRESQGPTPAVLLTVERMIALRSASIFFRLAPEELAELARSSRERTYAAGEALCVEGERGNEIFFLLEGEVTVSRREAAIEKIIGRERAGGFIGEMAVLDPAPRSATVVAGAGGSRALILDGETFHHGLRANPAIAADVIRTLAQRLRGAQRG